jgi:hypothetical protein
MILYHMLKVISFAVVFNLYTMVRRNDLWKTTRLLRRKLLVDTRQEA